MKVALAAGTVAGQAKPGFTPPGIEELARKFPQLEIIELIGRGGMGAVYKARQKELDRIVALKILPPGIGDDAAFAERFAREAKALARLNHPGIVTIHDFGRADGLYFFVMEFVDGVNLRELLASSRVSSREALAIVPQICDALQFAHDHGIVHRDIKPENILLDRRGRVKVADFGLAKIVEGGDASPRRSGEEGGTAGTTVSTSLTDAGRVLGTPAYMAPEQVEHPANVDHRADIYALGVVFYQMLTGELPGKSLEPPSKKVQIDVRLDEVVLRTLEKKPELRYQQVSDVKTMVETIAGDAGVPQAEPGVGEGLPIGRALTKAEAERFGSDLARLFTRPGLLSFAQRTFLWFVNQALLLFDLFAPWQVFADRSGRRRFSLWLFLLMFSSTIGFLVYGELLAINLAQGLWHPTPPALALQEWQMFQLMVLFAVARLAGLNLGLKEVAGAGGAQSAIAITPRRLVRVFLTLLGLAALIFGTALASNWLNTVPLTALINIAGGAPWIAIAIAVGLLVVVGLRLFGLFFRLWIRVWDGIKEKTEESATSVGLPAVEAWLALIDMGNYAQSWETAAAYFQRTTGKEEWVRQMEHLRRPLGKVRSRKPSPPKFTAGWTSFGAQFAFATSFDGLPAATETVTFARQQPNGEWRAICYLIQSVT
jgi:tRNA A-37 threonylcarbamoyl transferase component Bud32